MAFARCALSASIWRWATVRLDCARRDGGLLLVKVRLGQLAGLLARPALLRQRLVTHRRLLGEHQLGLGPAAAGAWLAVTWACCTESWASALRMLASAAAICASARASATRKSRSSIRAITPLASTCWFVGDRHRGQITGDLGRDAELARRDEGVVGRFEVRLMVDEECAAGQRHHEAEQACRGKQPMAPQPALWRDIARRAFSDVLLGLSAVRLLPGLALQRMLRWAMLQPLAFRPSSRPWQSPAHLHVLSQKICSAAGAAIKLAVSILNWSLVRAASRQPGAHDEARSADPSPSPAPARRRSR